MPLAKLSPDEPGTVEVFELCINGQEIAPGYTEQNDPIQQRSTLEHQAGGEQQKLDEDFLVALEQGMPPAGGIGIGIDRLCMMLLGQESIRDVILFPQLKPKYATVGEAGRTGHHWTPNSSRQIERPARRERWAIPSRPRADSGLCSIAA